MTETSATRSRAAEVSFHPHVDKGPSVGRVLPEEWSVSSGWESTYARYLAISDLLVIVWAVMGAHVVRFGLNDGRRVSVGDKFFSPDVPLTYAMVSIGLVAAWWFSLVVTDSRQPQILGAGVEEYKRVFQGSFALFGLFAIGAYLASVSVARGYLAVAFPAGVIGLVASRALWRQLLRMRRRAGRASSRAIVVGSTAHVELLVGELRRERLAGYLVTGVCVPIDQPTPVLDAWDVPVVGAVNDAVAAMAETGADTLIVTASPDVTPKLLRQWGWDMEGTGAKLLVSPALTDVAGPRIHVRPVSGLPLLHVEGPRLPRSGALAKGIFDRVVAVTLLVVLMPVLIAVAAAVKFTSAGPVFYGQERIGEEGRTFRMWKFRSMVVNADAKLAELLAAQGSADTPLFKVHNDPRITPIGRFIRKYSLDELPQLWNVINGSMSLVGPRPQRQAEVDLYNDGAERRLMCKPGLTGLWQVSGRSNLSWQEAMRLDLYYVENWSFAFDLLLLWRTWRVVVAGEGAH